MRLVQGNKQAMTRFVAIATTTSGLWSSLVSARIGGGGLRQAPTKIGYDTTTPSTPLRQQQQEWQREGSSSLSCITCSNNNILMNTPFAEDYNEVIDRRGLKSIDDSLKIQIPPIPSRLAQAVEEEDDDDQLLLHNDIGVLAAAPAGTPTLASAFTVDNATLKEDVATETTTLTPVCTIGYYGDNVTNKPPTIPASKWVKEGHHKGRFGITFNEETQTVKCYQDYDSEDHYYSCSNLAFDHCNVQCDGDKSCWKAKIENAPLFINCLGDEACYGVHISSTSTSSSLDKNDGITVYCGGENSCRSSYMGNERSVIAHLECHAGKSCAHVKTYNVRDVFCTGPGACYGAELSGIRDSILCHGSPFHPNGYYEPTCGGKGAFIEAHEDSREKGIIVTCSGDFACVGYGHSAHDEKDHPVYFDIDVGGPNGELVCENDLSFRLMVHHNDPTFVCRYIDIVQGCSHYECHYDDNSESKNGNEKERNCDHIFSINHHELCFKEGSKNPSDNQEEEEHEDFAPSENIAGPL